MGLLFSEERIREIHDYNQKEEGRAEGRVEGRVEGRAEGRVEGTEQNQIFSIKSLMKNLGWTIEQAMDALSIPAEARSKLQAQL